MKNVGNSQPYILMNLCAEFSKANVFSLRVSVILTRETKTDHEINIVKYKKSTNLVMYILSYKQLK